MLFRSKKQYFRSEMKEGTSVDQHLKHMKDITDKLAAIGVPVSEEDQVVTLLGSLPRRFATLVNAIEARMDGVSLDYVQQALIHEEMKQSELSGQLSIAESALTGDFKRNTPCDHQNVMDVAMWVIFTVIVQMIHPHVLDLVMSVIFSVTVLGSVNGTKQR